MGTVLPLVLLLLFIVFGMPVGFALGSAGAIGLLMNGGLTALMGILSTTTYRSVADFSLTTIPLFILMAEFASEGGYARDLFTAAYKWIGHFPGGLASATVVASAGFGAMSGSSTAAAAALSKISIPEMLRFNYKGILATGVVAVAGTLAVMIPPSTALIVYGITTQVSIGKLFIGGIVPGLVLAAAFIIAITIWTKLRPELAPPVPAASWKERFSSLSGVWPMVVLLACVIGGIYSGFATSTEIAAVASVVALGIGIVMRRIRGQGVVASLRSTVQTATMIFTIIIGATIFGYFVTRTGLSSGLVNLISNSGLSSWVILLALVVFYLILGMFMDQIAILLLTLPLVFPVITQLGFDPVWFGIFVTVLVEIGLVTPPVGLNAFVVNVATGRPLEEVFKGGAIMLIPAAIVLVLLIFFPQIALWLPGSVR